MPTSEAGIAVRTAVDRARVLKEWHRSGLSARVFAERVGLSPWTLYDWRRRERAKATRAVSPITRFVRVEPEAELPPSAEPWRSIPGAVVVLPGGARVEFHGDSEEMFARAVAGLLRGC